MHDEQGETTNQLTGTFADFDGYEGDEDTDVTTDRDAWGVAEQMPRLRSNHEQAEGQ